MIYFPELYYFVDQKDFPLEKAVLVTAQKVSSWCSFFRAEIIYPAKGLKQAEHRGLLPTSLGEKEKSVGKIVKWLFKNSEIYGMFVLFMDDKELGEHQREILKFDHRDDTCCWNLNLSEREFKELKIAWEKEDLPGDLFYPEDAEKKIIQEPKGLAGKILFKLGYVKEKCEIYTPKRWEEEKKRRIFSRVFGKPDSRFHGNDSQ